MTEEGRAIVFAVDLQNDAHRALLWVLRNVYRLGDTIHLVHVAKLKDESPEIFHGNLPSFSFHERTQQMTDMALEKVKQEMTESFNKDLEAAGVSHQTHLFLEGENAPADDVAAIINRVYNEVSGAILVASRSNRTRSERWYLGSVADSLTKLQHPLILVVPE